MHVQRTVPIEAPPASVWRCLTDADLRRKWLTQLVSEEPDVATPAGRGASATLCLRQNNEVVSYRSTVIDWDVGRRLSVGITGGKLPPDAVMGVIYDLAPGEGSANTVLDYHFQFPLTSFAMKLLYPLIRLGATAQIDRDMAGLKALAESLAEELGEA